MPQIDGKIPCVMINAPEWFKDPGFVAFLECSDLRRTATWHIPGQPVSSLSDVFVTYDAGEGSDDEDIPEHIWNEICLFVRAALPSSITYCVVWIKNLE